jgi:hypothetical protein
MQSPWRGGRVDVKTIFKLTDIQAYLTGVQV